MVFFFSGIFLLISLILTPIFYKRIFINPLVIFFAIWFFVFSLYQLNTIFNYFYFKLTEKAQILFILSFISFFIGSLSVAVYQHIKKSEKIQTIRIQDFHLKSIYKITKILFFFFAIGIALKVFLLLQRYKNPIENLGVVRGEFISGLLKYPQILYFFSFLGYLIIVNLGILLVFSKKRKIILFFIFLTLVTAFLNDLTVASRGFTFNFFLLLITTIFATFVVKGKVLKLRHYLFGIISFVLIIIFLTTIVYLRGDKSVGFLKLIGEYNYLYLVGTIPATSFFIENPFFSNLPLFHTFGGIYKFFDGITGLFGFNFLGSDDLRTFYANITELGPFNSATSLAYYYFDLKEVGVIIFSYLLGFISSFLFFKVVYNKRIIDIQLYAFILSFIIYSIENVLTNGAAFWILLFFIFSQHFILQQSYKKITLKTI